MQNVALTWQQSGWLAAGLFAGAAVTRQLGNVRAGSVSIADRARHFLRAVTPFITEIAIIATLYSIWQFAGSAPVFDADGAVARGSAIERFEHTVHLPSEHSAQAPLLHHPLLAQAANLYYATMHFAVIFALLLWVFVRHRDQYRRVRTLLVMLTVGCFVVQLLPVAPPRLLPDAGFTDTAAQYGQSVYTAFGAVGPDQLSAMPSLHVGWAALAAVVAVTVSTSPWRWVVALHFVLTVYIVSATANHYWLDGIVAVLILAASVGLSAGARAAFRLHHRGVLLEPDPVLLPPEPVAL